MVMDQDFFPLSIDIQFVMIHLNQAEQKTRVESEYFLCVVVVYHKMVDVIKKILV